MSNIELNTEEFIRRSKEKHGDKYDYSKSIYKNARTKIKIVCPNHGEFEQKSNSHFGGQGCIKCGGFIKSTIEEFIKKSKEVHGDKYDYSKVDYINNKTKVIIVCPDHGEFEQRPDKHTRNHGCKECGMYNSRNARRKPIEEFIQKSIEVHNNKYNYSKTIYKTSKTKTTIICPKHGEFKQVPYDHLQGYGCKKCAYELPNHNLKTFDHFLKKSKEKHGNKYDYSKVDYVNIITKVTIICPKHGEFKQRPIGHYSYGCPTCGGSTKLTTEKFIMRSKIIHSDKYDYSKVDYINMNTKVKIICSIHGEFEQRPSDHIKNHGCINCANELAVSRYELELLELYKDFNPISSDRTTISPLELDIIFPNHKLAVEFNGSRWHNEDHVDSYYHKMKSDLCETKGYRLIHIFEYDWINPRKRRIILNNINTHLNINTQIKSDNCEIREVKFVNLREFLFENHLQGHSPFTKAYGLYHKNKLVQVISLKVINKTLKTWETKQICTLIGYTVIGGTHKLFEQCKIYLNSQNFKELTVSCDRGTCDNKIYNELGFIKFKDSEPNYVWQRNNKILPKTTKKKNLAEQGYRRIYNSGSRTYTL